MKPAILILTTGAIWVTTLFACAPPPFVVSAPPRPLPGGPITQSTAVCAIDPTTKALSLNPVQFVVTSFVPTSNTVPTQDKTVSPNQDVQIDLNAAFNAAAGFQTLLCNSNNLNGIFIDPTGCAKSSDGSTYDPTTCNLTGGDIANHSWGLRVYGANGNDLGKYVGISLGLWKNDPTSPWSCGTPHAGQVCAPPLQIYETRRIQALFQTIAPNAASGYLPYFSNVPTSTNTAAMSVLAALAHEFGHVDWWISFVPAPGGTIVPNNFCNGKFYYKSWVLSATVPQYRWITFGKLANNNYHLPDDIDISQIQQDLQNSDYKDAGDLIQGLYSGTWPGSLPPNEPNVQNGRWASALAAFSPDEDFVETFELQILTNANPPLQSLPITIRGTKSYTDDIPANLYGKPELLRKMSCIGSLPG